MSDQPRRAYWTSVRRLTIALLSLWLLANIVGPWFARDLDELRGSGFPSAFWVTAQGGLLLYLGLTVVYVLAMVRIEKRYLEALTEADVEPDPGGQ